MRPKTGEKKTLPGIYIWLWDVGWLLSNLDLGIGLEMNEGRFVRILQRVRGHVREEECCQDENRRYKQLGSKGVLHDFRFF